MRYEIVTKYPDAELLARWNAFIAGAEYATHYVAPHFFLDPFAGQGERFAVLAVDRDDRIVAVVTGIRAGRTLQSGLAVRPQSAFLTGCDRDEAAAALAEGLAALAGESVELLDFFTWTRLTHMARLGFVSDQATGTDRVVMLNLSKGSETLFKDFAERRRSTLRKIMREKKVEVKVLETWAESAELYEIHKDWNARKGYEPQSFGTFLAGAAQTDHRRIFIALCEGKIIAGTFFRFCRGGVVEFAANHSYQEYQRLHPNELIMWRAIEWAAAEGFMHFSLGGSHPFLTKFGGELIGAYRHRLDRTFLKRHETRERLSRLAVKTFQSLPASVRGRIKSAAARV